MRVQARSLAVGWWGRRWSCSGLRGEFHSSTGPCVLDPRADTLRGNAIAVRERPSLSAFGAVWSDVCRALDPVLADVAREYDGRLIVAKVDIDDDPETTRRYDIANKVADDGRLHRGGVAVFCSNRVALPSGATISAPTGGGGGAAARPPRRGRPPAPPPPPRAR
ncbi:thioredoxin family protein [Amycolatopsis sp. NPDC059021]|uniref:thioredoxin family protein n=1 Tax=Amycolatopsis sp. NPDC059021 TaxID=3346704 RepID=UPI00366E0561